MNKIISEALFHTARADELLRIAANYETAENLKAEPDPVYDRDVWQTADEIASFDGTMHDVLLPPLQRLYEAGRASVLAEQIDAKRDEAPPPIFSSEPDYWKNMGSALREQMKPERLGVVGEYRERQRETNAKFRDILDKLPPFVEKRSCANCKNGTTARSAEPCDTCEDQAKWEVRLERQYSGPGGSTEAEAKNPYGPVVGIGRGSSADYSGRYRPMDPPFRNPRGPQLSWDD